MADLMPLQHVGSLDLDTSRDAALYVAGAAIDGGWVGELRDQLEMLGLVQPRQPSPAAKRRWGGQP